MFQSIARGWTFLKQSWYLGQKAPILLFPSLTGLGLSIVTLLVASLPAAILINYMRKNSWGQFTIGALIGLSLIILIAIINVTTILSSNLAGSMLTGQVPSTADAWKRVSFLGAELYWMGIGLPINRIWLTLRRLFHTPKKPSWEDAEHLLVPVLANEQVTLREAPGRIGKMQADNCVFLADSVGIRKVSVLITATAILIGLAAGIGIAWWILSSGEDPGKARALAFLLGVLMTAIFTLPVALFSSYAITLFNTSLYCWGKSVRDARKGRNSINALIPEPLAVALGVRSGR